ncbi:MAG: hypothetical protein ACK5UY_00585 [Holosporales bacterium]
MEHKFGFLFFLTVLMAPMIAMSLPYGMPAFAIFYVGALFVVLVSTLRGNVPIYKPGNVPKVVEV